jgi:hypothetical protein
MKKGQSWLGVVALLFLGGMLTLAQPTPYRLPKETRWPIQGLSPSALAVADFNEDGLPDLAVAYLRCDSQQRQLDPRDCPQDERNGRVVVFLSQGVLGRDRWSFSEKVQRLVVGDFPRSLVAGDLNNDGHSDLIVGNFGSGPKGSLSIFLNDGQGTFRSRPVFSLEANPKDLALGDFNNDGILDVIVAFIGTRRVAILLGDGKGDFAYPDEYQVGNAPQAVAVGDFNGDGFLDAAAANLSQSQSISILLNDKRGGFGAFTAARHISIDDAPFDIVAADFNRDGLLDLVTSHAAATDSVMIWLGDGRGNFQPFGRFEAGSDPSALAVADFNGDGFLDVAATNGGSNSITMLFGDGQGRLENFVLLVNNGNIRVGVGGRQDDPVGQLMDKVALPVGATPIAVVAAQLNRDRLADLIVANQTSNDISILLSRAP